VLGAMAHSIGQIFVVSIVYNTFYMMYYLPVLIIAAVVAGILVALVSVAMLSRLKNVWGL
jgi:heptaprenyl diphosphate synthase